MACTTAGSAVTNGTTDGATCPSCRARAQQLQALEQQLTDLIGPLGEVVAAVAELHALARALGARPAWWPPPAPPDPKV